MSERGRRSRKSGRFKFQPRSTTEARPAAAVQKIPLLVVGSRLGWPVFIFCFFMFSPLVFVSGYTPDGHLFCTLYDLPKAYFIATFILLGCFFYALYLFCQLNRVQSLQCFMLRNGGLKILVLLLIFLTFSIASASVRAAAIYGLLNYLLLTLFFIVSVQLFARQNYRWSAIYGLIAALSVFSLLGIIQYFGYKIPFLLPIMGPASTFGYRNPAAHFIAVALPFALFAVWRHWHLWRGQGKRIHLVLFSVLLLSALGALVLLFMNYSRTAILAFILGSLALPWIWFVAKKNSAQGFDWNRQNWGRVLAGVIVVVVVLSVLIISFPKSRKRVESSFNKFRQGGVSHLLEFRYYHWGNSLMMIKDHPLLGVGLGNWRFNYPLYYKSFTRDPLFNYQMQVRKTHNDYLQLAAECGIPALCFFLLLWGRQFYLLRYVTVESDDGEDWRLPLLASLLAFSVIMFFSFPMQMAYSRMFCFFLLALGEARAWPALSS